MNEARFILREIAFTGSGIKAALPFSDGLNFVYGASNTGKSFALAAIDFMLGGSADDLAEIPQRTAYERAWLGMTLPSGRDVTLARSTKGGEFSLLPGLQTGPGGDANSAKLRARHDAKRQDTLSHLLLSELNLLGRRVAKNKAGETENLTFRQLAPFVLVDETSIQAPRSPIISGQRDDSKEYAVFRLLLSGKDDSDLLPALTPRQWKTFKEAKASTLEELSGALDQQIGDHLRRLGGILPDAVDIELLLAEVRADWERARRSLNDYLVEKRSLLTQLGRLGGRLSGIDSHVHRFARLDEIYQSDIGRLEAIEEAGFLLAVGANRDCPLCGAPASAQLKAHGTDDIDQQRRAALVEIEKIRMLRADLEATVHALREDRLGVQIEMDEAQSSLQALEAAIATALEPVSSAESEIRKLMDQRDATLFHSQLLAHKRDLDRRREEFASEKRPKADQHSLKTPDSALHGFCQVMSEVLRAWHFPGQCQVSFDEDAFDVKIDGKARRANGKGVRALTHAAFKVALLLYCQRENLPHPGFLVLDSPLVAYRDPIKSKKGGALEPDERIIAASSVREKFFEHLAQLASQAQFIVLDNIDPPAGIDLVARTQLFTANTDEGRYGFFPG